MKYYLIAGERSGDLHGGNLIKALKTLDKNADFKGFGGDEMQSHGMNVDRHYRDLAFMGFWEVLINLSRIKGYLKQAKEAILSYNPDVVILIDYGGFNLKIASFLKKHKIKCYYYITPKVWAWNQGRAKKIKHSVDKMFVILPFEKDFYKKFDWKVDYVGNPVLDAVKSHDSTPINIQNNGKPVVSFLPGSRKQEILKVGKEVTVLIKNNPQLHFVIAKVDNVEQQVYDQFDGLSNVEFFNGKTYDLLMASDAAIVTSGTATLETALLKVPQIVIYKTSPLSYIIGRAVIKVNYISLVNLIADDSVVPELIQDDFNVKNLERELNKILEEDSIIEKMINAYGMIEKKLDIGSASTNTAKLIYNYLISKH